MLKHDVPLFKIKCKIWVVLCFLIDQYKYEDISRNEKISLCDGHLYVIAYFQVSSSKSSVILESINMNRRKYNFLFNKNQLDNSVSGASTISTEKKKSGAWKMETSFHLDGPLARGASYSCEGSFCS
jgi:hypothetical protein